MEILVTVLGVYFIFSVVTIGELIVAYKKKAKKYENI